MQAEKNDVNYAFKEIMKKVWIVNPYGALPTEGWLEYRSFKLARELISRGFEVTIWISKFEHRKKQFRENSIFRENSEIHNNLKIIGIDGPGYKKNISMSRIFHENHFGKLFYKEAINCDEPDVIIIGDPSLFFSKHVSRYLKNRSSKLIVDIIDLWPELFKVALPKLISKYHKYIFYFLYQRRKKLIGLSDGVVGCTNDYLQRANVPKDKPQAVSYFGIDADVFLLPKIGSQSDNVREFTNGADLSVIFAGTYGSAYDIDTIFKAISLSVSRNENIKYVFIGDGIYSNEINRYQELYPNTVLKLESAPLDELVDIYSNFDIGLCTYSKNSTVSMPTKFYDNLGAGLVTITSLNGEILSLINKHQLGLIYEAGNYISLFEAIIKLKDDKKLLIELKSNVRLAAQDFSAITQYKTFANFIEKIIA